MSETEVLDLVHWWAAAEQGSDPAQLDRLLAEGFVGIRPVGFVLSRQQWPAGFGNGLVNRAFVVRESQVHQHGAPALVVGVDAQETSAGGRDNSGRFRFTLTLVHSDREWLVAGVHFGALPSRPARRESAAKEAGR